MKFSVYTLLIAGLAASCAPQAPTDAQNEEFTSSIKEVIVTEMAPAAIGPYSQAVKVGNTVWVAGQIGLDPVTGTMVEGGLEAETKQVMANIEAILKASGLEFKDVVQSQVFLADLNDYQRFNELYAGYFSLTPPARAVVEVARLPRDARVEVMVVAARTR